MNIQDLIHRLQAEESPDTELEAWVDDTYGNDICIGYHPESSDKAEIVARF